MRAPTKTHGHIATRRVIALLLFSAVGAQAQADKKPGAEKPMHHDMSKMDMSGMMNEPHAALAMAYGQSIGTFARTLHKQAEGSTPLDVALARAAVAEIRRSLDQMDAHHSEHMKTMSEDMRAKMAAPNMAAMMKDMETHRSMLKDAVVALENDVRVDQLNAKQVATDSGNVLKHLDEMSKMHEGKMEKKMK